MTRYKVGLRGKVVRHHAELPSIWEVLGLIQGPPLRGWGEPSQGLMAQRGDPSPPRQGVQGARGKGGGAILVPHPPFPTQEGELWELGLS